MSSIPPSAVRHPPSLSAPPPTIIVNGPGVLAEQPVIQEAPVKTVTVPISSRRRLVEAGVLFIGAILFLRTVTVEPFGVPTGSMAPTLSGNHKALDCPRCGYPILVGSGNGGDGPQPCGYGPACCPNCGQAGLSLDNVREVAGDRLMVDKNVFEWRSPRRWEAAVFRCPSDLSKPYVKRVVGLPGESILIRDGDVYANGELLRKTLAQAREVRLPVFDSDHAPAGDGWRPRWVVEGGPAPAGRTAPVRPAPDAVFAGEGLLLDGTAQPGAPFWLTYRHWLIDEKREEAVKDAFCYNGESRQKAQSVYDFLVECEVEVLDGAGRFLWSLTDGADTILAEAPVGSPGAVRLHHAGVPVRSADRPTLEAGKTYRLELALVDRRARFAIAGREPFAAVDLPAGAVRRPVARPLRLGVEGAKVRVKHLRLYRDIHYTTAGKHGVKEPCALGPGEFFLLGDNSSNSDDSRFWPAAGVPESAFLGKPFVLHQPSRWAEGDGLGRHWQVQTIDWDRV